MASRHHHPVAELPWLIGVAVGWVLCWWRGRAFVPMSWPAGFDWERYLRETWAYTHPGTMVSTWLEPMYPWLLSTLGGEIGWTWAGAVISSVALIAMVVGAPPAAAGPLSSWFKFKFYGRLGGPFEPLS